jgi:hypothetical protein
VQEVAEEVEIETGKRKSELKESEKASKKLVKIK